MNDALLDKLLQDKLAIRKITSMKRFKQAIRNVLHAKFQWTKRICLIWFDIVLHAISRTTRPNRVACILCGFCVLFSVGHKNLPILVFYCMRKKLNHSAIAVHEN